MEIGRTAKKKVRVLRKRTSPRKAHSLPVLASRVYRDGKPMNTTLAKEACKTLMSAKKAGFHGNIREWFETCLEAGQKGTSSS